VQVLRPDHGARGRRRAQRCQRAHGRVQGQILSLMVMPACPALEACQVPDLHAVTFFLPATRLRGLAGRGWRNLQLQVGTG